MNMVRAVRVGRGLTQSKLARLVEVPESQLCAVERGRLHPWPKLRRRLAEELQVPENELFPQTAGK
ncbi:MAG: helix-turn-helix transcriptional regulator [Dehalococcoidia bacterium]|nr:helix-turn-helix transcriptional regulator [Dehalococcoidia bacterium]